MYQILLNIINIYNNKKGAKAPFFSDLLSTAYSPTTSTPFGGLKKNA